MTAKDFRLIAEAVRQTEMSVRARRKLIAVLVQLLADDNQRFDRQKFTDACQPRDE